MIDDQPKKRLGRGLAALIGEMDKPVKQGAVERIHVDGVMPIEMISANRQNPRRSFDDAELEELAASVREYGIVQPIVVRQRGPEKQHYEIIAGERRWRAAQRAGLIEIPVIIRDVDDRTALELALIENIQRANLNPLEEAEGYRQLMDEHGYVQTELAQVIGKSRSHVANTLRLLKLPDSVQSLLTNGALSAGHARTLITATDPSNLAQKIVKEGLSVRQAENLALETATAKRPLHSKSANQSGDADERALEKLMGDATGLRVRIRNRKKGGDVIITYRSLEQLDEICRRIQNSSRN